MVLLDGEHLTLDAVHRVAVLREEVSIPPHVYSKMERSRAVVERLATGDGAVYAVNTGVGLLADVRIPAADLEQLQRNVVRSHACGVGEPLSADVVRGIMLIRANVLAKGFSGIRPEIAQRLCDFLNRGIVPVVPSRGSVGASGDLAPLAHIALALIGEGEVWFEGGLRDAAGVLRETGAPPVLLAAKEGISLVNGTQAMLSIGCLALHDAEILCDASDIVCAMTIDAQRGSVRPFEQRVHEVRPHRGQLRSAANLRHLLADSEIGASHAGCGRVQDAYSLRCAPQVHGAVRDTLAEAANVFAVELNSATDNPLVFGDEIVSGGNFHGQPLAFALDYMAIAIASLAGISERRIDRLVNPALNESLPAFLAGNPGLESGLMMAQVTAAALVNENRVLATPGSTGSITTSGNKEDFVSMGMTSALKLQQIVGNTRTVLAIEAIAAARALDLLRPLRSSEYIERVREQLRAVSPEWTADRPPSKDIAAVARWLAGGPLTSLLEAPEKVR